MGYYGYNCNRTCGHCMNLTQCSPVNGTCLTGCAAGFFGPSCDEGTKLNQLIYIVCDSLDINFDYTRTF